MQTTECIGINKNKTKTKYMNISKKYKYVRILKSYMFESF